MLEKIIRIIAGIAGIGEEELCGDTELFEEGILDSFGLVQLIVELEGLGVTLDVAELERSEISTPEKIAALCK